MGGKVMDLVLRTSVVSADSDYRCLAVVGERLAAWARAIVAALGNAVPSPDEASLIRDLERRRDKQKAFGAFELGGRGFFG
jgi:hypothetical protein